MPNQDMEWDFVEIKRPERLKINLEEIGDAVDSLKEKRDKRVAERAKMLNKKFEERPFNFGDTVSVANIKRKTFKIVDVYPFEGGFAYVLDNYPANVLEENLTLVAEADNG